MVTKLPAANPLLFFKAVYLISDLASDLILHKAFAARQICFAHLDRAQACSNMKTWESVYKFINWCGLQLTVILVKNYCIDYSSSKILSGFQSKNLNKYNYLILL